MKWKKAIGLWVLLWILIEVFVLTIFNNYVFNNGEVKVEKKFIEKISLNEGIVNIPENSYAFSLSYDGKYTTYMLMNKLYIVDNSNGKAIEVQTDQDSIIDYYKWLPDRNRILIIKKEKREEINSFILCYYDLDRKELRDIKKISDEKAEAEVKDLQLSTLTNIVYIKLGFAGDRSSLYRVDIAHTVTEIDTKHLFIGNIFLLHHVDRLIYEDSAFNKVYVKSLIEKGEKEIQINHNIKNLTLLGVDYEDKIYVGEVQHNKITKIYFGSINKEPKLWEQVILENPMGRENIFITTKGKIYCREPLKRTVYELLSGERIHYSGEFILFYENGVACKLNGKLKRFKFSN